MKIDRKKIRQEVDGLVLRKKMPKGKAIAQVAKKYGLHSASLANYYYDNHAKKKYNGNKRKLKSAFVTRKVPKYYNSASIICEALLSS